MLEEIFGVTRHQMDKAVEFLQRDLAHIRTGRASVALLDGVRVSYYGSPTPLIQLASISAPEPRLIAIRPYEQKLIGDIEKAIRAESALGLNPSNDGQIIRLPIPELTQERRIELTRVARHRAEEGRVAVRHARREGLDLVDEAKKEGEISQDESHQGHERIQVLTDDYIKKIDEVIKNKEAEIMEV